MKGKIKKKLRFKTEAEFQAAVVAYAQLQGWKPFHQGDSRTCTVGHGYPDLTIISERENRIVFAELKRAGGETTIEQVQYAALILSLNMPGVEYYLWYPKDMPEVLRVLRARPDADRMNAFRELTAKMTTAFQKRKKEGRKKDYGFKK